MFGGIPKNVYIFGLNLHWTYRNGPLLSLVLHGASICLPKNVQNIAGILDGYEGIDVEFFTLCRNIYFKWHFLPLSPPGSRGIVVTVRAGDCQICGFHIAVTAWRIYSAPSSLELYRPVIVHCPGHLPICPIWACPWTKNLSNLAQIGSRLFGTQICDTTG